MDGWVGRDGRGRVCTDEEGTAGHKSIDTIMKDEVPQQYDFVFLENNNGLCSLQVPSGSGQGLFHRSEAARRDGLPSSVSDPRCLSVTYRTTWVR
jgi:hypothetical protein